MKIILTFLLTLTTLYNCQKFSFGQTSPKDETRGAVVTFIQGQVTLLNEGKETLASLGDVIKPGDRILSKLGKIDLQTYRGEIIRIKENSDVLLRDLPGSASPNTDIHIWAGNLLVKSVKLKATENLSISSPTMVAGVRGTIFSFELEKGAAPKVKVYEGAVAIAFKTGPKLIEQNDGLSKENYDRLVKTLEENEVILEPGETMEVSPSLNDLVYLINAKMVASSLTNEELANFSNVSNAITKVESPITPREKAEAETLVSIDNSLVQQQVKNQTGNPDLTNHIVETIEKEHESKRNEALNNIAADAEKIGLESEEDIQNHYSVLETIHKSNGEVLSGAVVAQLGEIFIVHSTKGVFQLNVDDIEYVEYKNFKVKTKAKR